MEPTTRDRILEAALDLFSEHGYRGATTAEIARRAGIAEGTIYRYFKDKKELILACVEPVIQEALRRENALPTDGSARDRLHRRIRERVRTIQEHLPVFNILFSESRFHSEIADILLQQVATSFSPSDQAAVAKALEKGSLRHRLHLPMMTIGLTAAVWAMVQSAPAAETAFSDWIEPNWYERLDEDIADFFTDALLAPER